MVLAVGTRLASPEILDGQTVVQIDVDPAEIGRNYDKTVGLVGGRQEKPWKPCTTRVSGLMPAQSGREQEIAAVKHARRTSEHAQSQPLAGFVGAIRNAVPEDGIIICGMTQVGYFSRAYFPVYHPGTFFTSYVLRQPRLRLSHCPWGQVARPDKAVVAISGDGGFMYNVQEMATAVQQKINAVVIVFNDSAFGNVLRDQRDRFQGRVYGSELHNPDFMMLAKAFGVRGARATTAEELEAQLREALDAEAPTLIEVPCGPMPYPY